MPPLKSHISDVVIGFSEDDYEGLEDNPNTPCTVTAVVSGRTLEIPLQIQLTPRTINDSATGRKGLISIHLFTSNTLQAI